MLLQIEFVIDSYDRSPNIVAGLLFFIGGIILMKLAGSNKASVSGFNLHASRGKLELLFKKITYSLGVFFIFLSVIIFFGFVDMPTRNIESENVEEIPDEEGYGDMPVIRLPRNYFERAAHEYENYTLFAKSFDHESNAVKLVSKLDMYNIRNVNIFKIQCDSFPKVRGEYFVFLGRRCNSLSSIKRYEKKYETMFKGDDFIDLKIIKWEKAMSKYTSY